MTASLSLMKYSSIAHEQDNAWLYQSTNRVILLLLTLPLPCTKQVVYKRCSNWKHQLYKLVICTSFALKITQFYYQHIKNPMANNTTALNISLVGDFAMNNSDCSYLFKEVHVSATILQALCASVIAAISVPTHLLLIVSMVIYHDNIENFMILSISFLVANTIVSIFLNGEIFFTPLIWAWWFGCWVCKVLLSLWHVVCLLAGSLLHLTGSVEYSLLWSTLDIAKSSWSFLWWALG